MSRSPIVAWCRAPVVLGLAAMGMLALVRGGLAIAYWPDFQQLSAASLAGAFWRGLRFDLSITAATLGLPMLALWLPLARRGPWRAAWGWLGFAALVALTVLAVSDAVYYGHVRRHTGPEASAIVGELGRLAMLAIADYAGLLGAVTAATAVAGWAWHHWALARTPPVPQPPWRLWASAPLLIAACVVAIRGGAQRMPMNIVNAFDGVPRAAGMLTLNGPYAIAHSLRSADVVPVTLIDRDEARPELQRHLFAPQEHAVSPELPIMRTRPSTTRASLPNVVILLLEGWHPMAVDAYRQDAGLEPLGLTPEFDALSARGRRFTHFFANGQRSAEAFSSLLAGIPAVPGVRYIGLGLEQNRLSYLGRLAEHNGYPRRILVRGAYRDAYRLDAIASLAGFDTYLGYEDIDARDHLGKDHAWGASDQRTYATAHALFRVAEQPFFGLVFTLSTHAPWTLPGPEWQRLPHHTQEQRYLNTVHYADACLGAFMRQAEAAGYADNTIFVIVADHVAGMPEAMQSLEGKHRVPLLLLGPGVQRGVDATYGSHLDLMGTIMQLAGWGGSYAALGRSLLDPQSAGGAGPLVTGTMVSWIDGSGHVSHDLHQRLSGAGDHVDALERRLLSFTQETLWMLRQNKVAR